MAGIQIGGLASGLDTESIIAQLMQIEQQPITRMQQQKAVSQVKEGALKDILSRVKNLQMEAQSLKSVTTWLDTQTVDSSDASKISATRTGGAAPGAYSLTVNKLASGDQWSMDYAPPAADGTFSITNTATGNAQTVTVKAGDSLDTVVANINSDVNSKVYAVNVNNKLVLSSRDTGAASAFTVSQTAGLTGNTQLRVANDAEYSLDGGTTLKYSGSNVVTDGIAGISFTLKSVTAANTPVTLNVSNPQTDVSAVKNAVKSFVDQYNSTIDLIRTKVSEQKVKDPKTDSDRAQGVLFNDSQLNGLLQRLRSSVGAVFATGDSSLDSLDELGISTGAATGGAANADSLAGKLVIDDTKLTNALSTKPQVVRAMLGATTGIDGLGSMIDTMLKGVVQDNGDFDSRIKSADKEQADYDTQIASLNTRIDAKTTLLRAQFTAMEAAIQKSQTTQGSLANLATA